MVYFVKYFLRGSEAFSPSIDDRLQL